MTEILFWMWLGSIVGAILVSPRQDLGGNVGGAVAAFPVWVFMMLPITMIGWVVEIVRIKA